MPWIAWGFTLIGTILFAFGFPEIGYAFLAVSLAIQLLVLNQQRKKSYLPKTKLTRYPWMKFH